MGLFRLFERYRPSSALACVVAGAVTLIGGLTVGMLFMIGWLVAELGRVLDTYGLPED